MSEPNGNAIAAAEDLLRRCRTGEVTGFVAVSTGHDDEAAFQMAGHISLTATACLLEHIRLVVLRTYMERFGDRSGPSISMVETDDLGEDP